MVLCPGILYSSAVPASEATAETSKPAVTQTDSTVVPDLLLGANTEDAAGGGADGGGPTDDAVNGGGGYRGEPAAGTTDDAVVNGGAEGGGMGQDVVSSGAAGGMVSDGEFSTVQSESTLPPRNAGTKPTAAAE